jgi:hypothetical protein
MTAGSYGTRLERPHTERDAGRGLALVMAGAGASGLLALVTLVSGGGLVAAILVYVLGGSAMVPALAAAPHFRHAVAIARQRASAPWPARQHS